MPEVRGPVRERTNAGAVQRAGKAAELKADRRSRAGQERHAGDECVLAFADRHPTVDPEADDELPQVYPQRVESAKFNATTAVRRGGCPGFVWFTPQQSGEVFTDERVLERSPRPALRE